MKKNFKTSLYFYILLAIILSFINYSFKNEIIESVIFGLIGALCVFFVPLIFRNLNNRK